jgi:hypothetical protein
MSFRKSVSGCVVDICNLLGEKTWTPSHSIEPWPLTLLDPLLSQKWRRSQEGYSRVQKVFVALYNFVRQTQDCHPVWLTAATVSTIVVIFSNCSIGPGLQRNCSRNSEEYRVINLGLLRDRQQQPQKRPLSRWWHFSSHRSV